MSRPVLHRRLPRLWSTQAMVWALLVTVAAGSSGIPLYRAARKDLSVPFPCQDSRCGCTDAATCWRSCCCHSLAERIAWAKQRGLAAPAYVLASQQQGQTACHESKRKGCCSKKETAARPPNEGGSLVCWESYQKCRGLAHAWGLFLGGQAIVDAGSSFSCPPPLPGEWLPWLAESARSILVRPDPPPPKLLWLA